MRKTIIALAAALVCALAAHAGSEAEYNSILSSITGAEKGKWKTVNLKSFGAKGDGRTDCKPAFDKAMAKAKKNGGAHIVLSAGTYLVNGPINLTSNVWIELKDGATIKFGENPDFYPVVETSWEGTFVRNYSPFIRGYKVKNVSITGDGTIDGNAGNTFSTWRKLQDPDKMVSREQNHNGTPYENRVFGKGHYLRPQLMQFFESEKINIEGVKITNSPFWCIHLLCSENIICRGLKYDAKLVNNDGIDPEYSRNILIENIYFNNGDDNVAIKSGRDNDGWKTARPTENIIIRNCKLKGLHGVVIGSEMSAGVRNVYVKDCKATEYCKRGLYLKSNADRGGFIKNINFENVEFDEVEDLIYITTKYANEGSGSTNYTEISDIHVNGVKCKKVRNSAIVMQGVAEKPIHDVTLENINVDEAKTGLSINNTKNVVVNNCNIGGNISGAPSQAK
ncbi:MAG: glycoside hydrolase family 28 protein [Paludibacteraceae bacterium]|nr:glycoside hydrolase family 28 protein [Paludibacteraceae bacterium]